jgi:hypothetical protein
MYILLGGALITSAIYWYMMIPTICILSAAGAVALATWINITHMRTDIFFKQAIHCMKDTECCLIHKVWSKPQSVLWTMLAFRTLAAVAAIISLYLTWMNGDMFFKGHYFMLTSVWIVTCSLWLLSNLPIAICLIQCAARDSSINLRAIRISKQVLDYKQEISIGFKKIRLISGSELIIRFRKSVSMWFLHDVVLGIFWFYLSFQLFDLTDDEDDSGWRTIFLSMLSWHIIFVVLHHIYLKNIWSCVHINTVQHSGTPCCAPAEADKWWAMCQLLGFSGIYIAVIRRMKLPELTNMGCSEPTLVLFCSGVFLLCVGKTMISNTLHGESIVQAIPPIGVSKNEENVSKKQVSSLAF